MASHGRKEANQLAGEVIPFHNEKSKVKEVDGMIPHDQKIMAPLFNLVCDLRNCFTTYLTIFGRSMIPIAHWSVQAQQYPLSSARPLSSST
jgi:hypothetical protein